MHRIPLALTLTAALALTACQQQTPMSQPPFSAQDIGVSTSAPANQNIDVTSNGAVSVGGQKIFPIGFYYVPYGLTNSTILNDLGKIKSAGFNIVHINQRTSEPDERDFLYTYLNSARTLSSPYNQKMYVAIGDLTYNATNNTCSNTDNPFNTGDRNSPQRNYLSGYQADDAFFSYSLSDDAFMPTEVKSKCTSTNLQARVAALNPRMDSVQGSSYFQAPNAVTGDTRDNKKPYYLTGAMDFWTYDRRTTVDGNGNIVRNPAFTAAWNRYRDLFYNTNIIGLQVHSGENGGNSAAVYNSIKQGIEIAEAGEDADRYSAAQLQRITPLKGFSDPYYGPNARNRSIWAEPMVLNTGVGTSVEKIGVEAWAAIAAGAKGLLWYAYRDTTEVMSPAYFTATTKVLADLKTRLPGTTTEINNIFLDGTKQYALNNSETVFGTSWEYGGKKYLLVVNTSPNVVTGDPTNLIFKAAGTRLSAVALDSTSTARATTAMYNIAPWTDPRGVILTGTLPAQSATLFTLQ